MLHFVPLSSVHIQDSFWQKEQRLVHDVVLPYQWKILHDRVPDAEPSYCMRNFRIAAGLESGHHGGVVFQDTDLYKWLESAAYCLALAKDAGLEAQADEAIELIEKAQQPDGYLNTYYTIEAPDKRFTNLTEGHELYSAGHLIEAAVAYYQATGKERVLKIAVRLADYLGLIFGDEDGKLHGYGGHPEIELALMKLYRVTQCSRHLNLMRYFLNARGSRQEGWFQREMARADHAFIWPEMARFGNRYFQDDLPLRRQRQAGGHAVRAMYLYCAMADLAREDSDDALVEACAALYANVTQRQMYVTGGIGSASFGERFTWDYDLPNDTMYAETCASIGLMMFSQRMFALTGSFACYDVWERALYNTVLAGMGRDGRHFFYVNPLAVIPEIARHSPTLEHVKTVRQKWFGVACCPPNLARTICSLGGNLYAMEDDALYLLSHIASSFIYEGVSCDLMQNGDDYTLTLDAPMIDVHLRIPDGFLLDGASHIAHPGGKAVYHYRLLPQVRFIRANAAVAADAGKVCVMHGATVYCAEEADNGKMVSSLYVDTSVQPEEIKLDFLPQGMCALKVKGWRRTETQPDILYSSCAPVYAPATLTLIPYCQWNNRGEGEMQVWLNEASPVKF